jgi:hypothetical protein
MLWLVLLKINAARIAFANRRAYGTSVNVAMRMPQVSLVDRVIPGWKSLPAPHATS